MESVGSTGRMLMTQWWLKLTKRYISRSRKLSSRVSSKHCTYYRTSSGHPAWLCRCTEWSANMNDTSNMKALVPKHQCIPQKVVNVLGFCNHFMKHVMAYMTPDQTAKTTAKFLWWGYISIFGAPDKLLSNQGAQAVTRAGTCLQFYKVSHHQVQPTLLDVSAPTSLTCWLLFPYDIGHRETLACQLLHCQVTWMTARHLQGSTRAVHCWG